MEQTTAQLSPAKIMQTGCGFWASKVLLAAVEFELFTLLGDGPKPVQTIQKSLRLHDRSTYDFLDALVALGFLERQGLEDTAIYTNTADVDHYLVKGRPEYIGEMLQMANHRLYPFWGTLEEGLLSGKPQNETKTGGVPLFEAIYADPAKLQEFLSAMAGFQIPNFTALAEKFPFSNYATLCDMGGANGALSCIVATRHSHLQCISFDLPEVAPVAEENIRQQGLKDRIEIRSGNFFDDDFPQADLITMGNILHDWSEDEKLLLMKKAFDSLPNGGAFIAIENVIDNERRSNVFGLLMSLNMLIETTDGFDYTFTDFSHWANIAGFSRTELLPLTGPSSAAIAFKA